MSMKSKRDAESEFDVSITDDSILWPEWSDVTLNRENWTIPRNGTDGLFLDTQLVQLPPSLKPHAWIRAESIRNRTEPLTVFVTSSEYPDLITNNKHILHSEFVRWFISALVNLQYCGRHGLEISGEDNNFCWNGRYQPWHGWLNVYSMNKAGKGVQHLPRVNPNGKYIVRLYLLGSWRRVIVDDMIPVNLEGLPVLPRTANDNELWPMLLSKALLKLCSLTWSQHREIVDFHPVSCLTGWVSLRLDIDYLSPKDKWDLLRKYVEHFEWKTDDTEAGNQDVKSLEYSNDGKKSKDTFRTKKSKESDSKKSKERVKKLTVLSKPRPVTLFLGLDDTRTLSSEAVPGLSPCWSHFVYVAQSRDVPLDPKDVKPPLARWKLYRWLRWAIEEGKIDPVEYFVPIRSLQIISPMKNFEKSIVEKLSDTNLKKIFIKKDIDDKTASEEFYWKSKRRVSSKESSEKTPKESRKNTPKESQKIGDPPVDISYWVDFNKMEPYVKDIHFFYKLDYFQYTARISDRYVSGKLNDQLSETRKGSKRDNRSSHHKESEFIDVYPWPWKMFRTRNEPLYIFVDSLEEKFFLINFSTFQVTDSRSSTVPMLGEGDTKPANPMIAPVANRDYLIVEKHNWFHRPKESNNLIHLSTAGTRSTVMELNRGRHLLRIYCRSETRCFVTISSDTLFILGDRRKMYQAMSTESMMIDQTVNRISRSVSNAYQAFGTDRYAEALMDYYNSYMPPVENIKHQHKAFNNYIHDCFIDEKIQLIKKHLPADQVPEVLRSLRIFFLNPTIGMQYFNSMSQILQNMREFSIGKQTLETSSRVDVESSDSMLPVKNQAATVIQSFFKGHIVRKYRKIHDPDHKDHQGVVRNLAKVVALFNYDKRESLGNQLLRNILGHLDRLHDIYPCSRDFKYILQMQQVTGTLTNVKPNQWLPIARFTVNPRITETVRAGVDLFVDLPRYSVRVFDNDSGREMLRVVNNVVTTRYPYSNTGYTIFGYGWSEDRAFKELTWTLSMITMKGQPMFYPLNNETSPPALTLPLLTTVELSNVYVPNVNMYISKWIVRTMCPSVVSFRLRTSYDRVKISFRVTEKSGRVLFETKGTSAVVLPFVRLGLPRKSSNLGFLPMSCIVDDDLGGSTNNDKRSTKDENGWTGDLGEAKHSQESLNYQTYYAEAFVLEDSWPLTESEWLAVTETKTRTTAVKTKSSTSIRSRSSKSEAPRMRRSSKQTNNGGQILETPHWVLQVVTDSGNSVEVFQDKTKEKKIAEMKETWVRDNPDSLQRGRELREAFLAKYEINPESESSTGDVRKKSSIYSEFFTKRENGDMAAESYSDTSKMEVRTTKPSRRFPLMDHSIYKVSEDEEDKPWIKTAHDEEVLSNMRKMNIIYANEDHHYALEDMESLLKRREEKYRELFSEHRDLFWERRALLEEANEKRKAYIGTTKPSSVQSSKKITKSKSTKSKSTKSKKV